PMHFVRVDVAGNISKRYSATGLRFPEGSGSCAKWAVHNAFLTPSVITKQYSVMPDGGTFFCFAKVAIQPQGGSVVRGTTYSVGLVEVEKLRDEYDVTFDWQPFELRPGGPEEGRALPAAIQAKMKAAGNPLQARAKELGITLVERDWIPSSRRAHECTEFARG